MHHLFLPVPFVIFGIYAIVVVISNLDRSGSSVADGAGTGGYHQVCRGFRGTA